MVTNVAGPSNLVDTCGTTSGEGGEVNLEVCLVDEVTTASNCGSALATKVGCTSEGLFHGLHGKVGVALVHTTEEGNLRLTCNVGVLGTECYELQETS